MAAIGHLADIHIGTPKYRGHLIMPSGYSYDEETYSSLLSRDVWLMLERSLEALAGEGVRTVVLSGDVFDVAKPDMKELGRAVRFFREKTQDGFRFVAAPGDHDTPGTRDSTPLDLLGNAVEGFLVLGTLPLRKERIGRERLEAALDGVTFYAVPFVKATTEKRRKIIIGIRNLIARWASERRGPKVLLAHFGMEPYTHESDSLGRPEDLLPRSVDYAAMGHIHKRIIVKTAPVPFAYPGSLVPLSVDEARQEHARGPLLVEVPGDGERPQVKEVRVEPVRLYLAVESGLDDLSERIDRAVRGYRLEEPPLIHVIVRAGRDAPPRLIRKALENVSKQYNVVLRLAGIKRPSRPAASQTTAEAAEQDPGDVELTVIREVVGGSERLAEAVLELKRAVLEGDEDRARRIILDLAFGDGIEEVRRLATKLGLRSPQRGSRPGRRGHAKRRGVGLDRFL